MDLLKKLFMRLLQNENVFDLELLSKETDTPIADFLKFKKGTLDVPDTFLEKFQIISQDIKQLNSVLKSPKSESKATVLKEITEAHIINSNLILKIKKGLNPEEVKADVISMFRKLDKILDMIMKEKENKGYRPEANMN